MFSNMLFSRFFSIFHWFWRSKIDGFLIDFWTWSENVDFVKISVSPRWEHDFRKIDFFRLATKLHRKITSKSLRFESPNRKQIVKTRTKAQKNVEKREVKWSDVTWRVKKQRKVTPRGGYSNFVSGPGEFREGGSPPAKNQHNYVGWTPVP